MRDIKIIFNGSSTRIDLEKYVEGKNLYEQKALVNAVTDQGSDPVYPDRGTTMIADSINGNAYDINRAAHIANFAALDTLYFINYQEYAAVQDSPDLIKDIAMSVIEYSGAEGRIRFSAKFTFADDTETKDVVDTTFVG